MSCFLLPSNPIQSISWLFISVFLGEVLTGIGKLAGNLGRVFVNRNVLGVRDLGTWNVLILNSLLNNVRDLGTQNILIISMMACCVQAKFFFFDWQFPQCSSGNSNLLPMSHLLRGKNCYCLGTSWDTGNGLKFFGPTPNGFAISTFCLSRSSERLVADLIDFNLRCWHEDRIKQLFLHHETQATLSIPLNHAWPEDRLTLELHKQWDLHCQRQL